MAVLVMLAATPALWGGQCNPPAPACGVGASCSAGTSPECAGECVPTVGVGEHCNVYPCNGTGNLCEYNLTCEQGVCVDDRARGFRNLFCTSNGAGDISNCPTGTYCHLFGGTYPRPPWAPRMALGTCSTPVSEGNYCESDWQPHGSLLACDAGLRCLADPRDPTRHACFRGCVDQLDCACTSDNPAVLDDCVSNVPELANDPGICAHCVPNGGTLETGGWACCNPNATGRADRCCYPEGPLPPNVMCHSDADCCPGQAEGARSSTCGSDGQCHACVDPGSAITDSLSPGCCFGDAYPAEGVCPDLCIYQGDVVEDGEPGCCGINSHIECDGSVGTCVGAPEEVFDCDDNDCDGLTDEALSDACLAVVPPAGNFQGCENLGELPGHYNCATGSPVCRVTDGYCAWDRLGNQVDHSPVGEECFSGATDCSGSACLAGEWCCSSAGGIAICDRIGHIMQTGASEPVLDLEPPMDCWRPGELNEDLECPYVESLCYGLTCGDCLAESGCGFCESVCLPGSAMGPDGQLECPATSWIFGAASEDECPP